MDDRDRDPDRLLEHDLERVHLTVSCNDCEAIPKVPDAGDIIRDANGDYQVMHNGVRIRTTSHYGEYNSEVIKRLRGHHEPQEELAFYEVLQRITDGGVICELGSFWAYYSLWFLKHLPNAHAILVEPLDTSLEAGRQNFRLNDQSGTFIRAAISDRTVEADDVVLWPGTATHVAQTTVDTILVCSEVDHLTILHADIPGHEVRMLKGARQTLRAKSVRWVFISTHGENLHQRCIQLLKTHGYAIVAEHTPLESYSVDGLIVASSDSLEPPIYISKRRTLRSMLLKMRAKVRVFLLEPLRLKPETY